MAKNVSGRELAAVTCVLYHYKCLNVLLTFKFIDLHNEFALAGFSDVMVESFDVGDYIDFFYKKKPFK